MDARVKTGVAGLDELLGGGLPAGGTYALLGYSGTGKTILSFQFIYKGVVDYNEPGIYITLEEDKDKLISNMKTFGWDSASLEAENRLKIIPYTKSILGDIEATFQKGIMSGEHERLGQLRQYLTVDSLFREIEQTCKNMGAKRVVIDSLTAVTLLADSPLMARMHIMWLIQKLNRLKITTIATLEEGIGFWRDILFLCDGIIYMALRERGGIFERGLVVEKMRGTSHDTGLRPLKISDSGVHVYPDEVINR